MLKWAGCVSDSLDVVTSRSLTSATISQLKTFTLAMRPPQGSLSDAEIWEMARNNGFMPPPQPWTFVDGGVKFGCDLYHVDKATLYELALLEVHSQYWETTSPEYLRRYHRGLQYHVELCFQTINSTSTYRTPPFLKPWLVRVIFMKLHNRSGREMVGSILNNLSKDERSKLEAGNFLEDGTIILFP